MKNYLIIYKNLKTSFCNEIILVAASKSEAIKKFNRNKDIEEYEIKKIKEVGDEYEKEK